jgi:hypothetical protein
MYAPCDHAPYNPCTIYNHILRPNHKLQTTKNHKLQTTNYKLQTKQPQTTNHKP